jgi:F-type H+-transporting ATPase subunit c
MLLECFKVLGAGTATVSLVGAGAGIGILFGCFLLALARNPLIDKVLFVYAILGFALTEAIALFGLMVTFLLLFAY